jgi:hypothetical protein
MRWCASDPGFGGFPIAFSLRALASPCRFRGGQSPEDHAMDRLLRTCLCAFALALLAACGAVPTLPVHDGDFGVAETFAVGESVTYDDGAHWKAVTTSKKNATSYTATIAHPALSATNGTVGIRAQGVDAEGNTIDQTITRAYGLK